MDYIANLLTSLRNAEMASHESLTVPSSKMTLGILQILKENGYITSYRLIEVLPQSKIEVTLVKSARHNYKRISKLGRRTYAPASQIPTVLNGLGIAILSTSQGLLSGKEARKRKIGGEVLCEVY